MKCSERQGDGFVRMQTVGDTCGIDHRVCYTCSLTLETANEKYKDVARITKAGWDFNVFNSTGYLHSSWTSLKDAIAACRDLDNAEPADRESDMHPTCAALWGQYKWFHDYLVMYGASEGHLRWLERELNLSLKGDAED